MGQPITILVVDDEDDVRHCVVWALQNAGYRVLGAPNGVEALGILGTERVDLILADIAMPRMNGYQLYNEVVQNPDWILIPFVFLTARSLDSDIRYGKELGVDDYLTKPFRPDDLLATVRGKLRRAQQLTQFRGRSTLSERDEGLCAGSLRVDSQSHQVWLKGRRVHLSAREFKLLEHLIRKRPEVVPLQELIRVTHGLNTDAKDAGALLRPLVRSVRRKLGYPAGQKGCIESVRGVGYQLVSPPQ